MGGGSSVEISLRTPEDAGPFDLALINPTHPEQDGIWSVPENLLSIQPLLVAVPFVTMRWTRLETSQLLSEL